MEREPIYDEKIAQIKQDFHGELSMKEAREKIELLRMEMVLDNAQCLRLLTESLEQYPNITKEVFEQYIQNSGLVIHPEVTKAFIDQLLETRANVDETIEILKTRFGEAGTALQVYRWLRPSKLIRGPKGELSLGDFPLAIMLGIAEQDDFNIIDPRENIGGFYLRELTAQDEICSTEEFSFPVIVINESKLTFSEQVRVEDHEVGHAFNNELKTALASVDRKTVWAKFDREDIYNQDSKEALEKLKIDWAENPDQARHNPIYQKILFAACASAKNELLADYTSGEAFTKHLKNLERKDGVYDYFSLVKDNSGLYNSLWDDYLEILKPACQMAAWIINTTDDNGLFSRKQIFKWVLAQAPIEQWQRFLTKTLFEEEASMLQLVEKIVLQEAEAVQINGEKPNEELDNDYNNLRKNLRVNQLSTIIPYIKEFLDKWNR